MKRHYLTKILCLVLVFVMSASLFLSGASAAPGAIPDYIKKYADRFLGERPAQITINGMTFTGKLRNSTLTQEEIDKVILEVMKRKGIDGDDIIKYTKQIEKMLENMGFSQKDMDQIIKNIVTVAGLALGGTAAGSIIKAIKDLYDIITSDNVAGAVADKAGKKIQGKITGQIPGSKVYGKGKGWAAGANMLANEWMKSQKKYAQMRDGLEATRQLRNLYSAIEIAVWDFMQENKKWNTLSFDSYDYLGNPINPQRKIFTLFGVECVEEWRLFMRLYYKGKYDPNPNVQDSAYDGEYEGEYTIEIGYDLSKLADMLPDLLQTPEWQNSFDSNALIWQMLWSFDETFTTRYSLSERGTWRVSRKIKGAATARIRYDSGTIAPSQQSDEKDVDISGAKVLRQGHTESIFDDWDVVFVLDESGFHGAEGGTEGAGMEFVFTANEDRIYIFPNGAGIGGLAIPWGANIWKRGDNAEKNGILKLMPRQ
ncbi:MAG: hypothetical protein LBH28_11425 [Oscillospiraceae bacterium]|jgi:hypothetical protein|nr:hypothetical protein [Oscillospiraceae bacterium]